MKDYSFVLMDWNDGGWVVFGWDLGCFSAGLMVGVEGWFNVFPAVSDPGAGWGCGGLWEVFKACPSL